MLLYATDLSREFKDNENFDGSFFIIFGNLVKFFINFKRI